MSEDTFKIYSPRSAVALVARMRSMLYAAQSTASDRNPKSALGETFEDLMECVDEFVEEYTSDNKEDGVTSKEICAEAIVRCPVCGTKITVGDSYGDDHHCDECDRIIGYDCGMWYEKDGRTHEATVTGVGERGELLLREDGREITLSCGEVSVRV